MDTKPIKVSEVNQYVKKIFMDDWLLSNVKVEGEISNFKHHYSGHMYFSLKDDRGKLRCVMFKNDNISVNVELRDGLNIIVTGYISVYEREGSYQLYAKKIEQAGIGDLFAAFEKLKAKLEKEGLFNLANKKQLPQLPKKIGIVTSSTGAAIRDILTIIKRRFPIADVLIYPVLVQGQQAPKEIIEGLKYLDNREDIDVIITGRGGGSIEELYAFNDETLAKTIYDMKKPIISAVGHETDFTIADFVADLRAPTPSAAAELATPELNELKENLYTNFIRLNKSCRHIFDNASIKLKYIKRSLYFHNPINQLKEKIQYQDDIFKRLGNLVEIKFRDNRKRIENISNRLECLNPAFLMDKGYSILLDEKGNMISSVDDLNTNGRFKLLIRDGMLEIKVVKINKGELYNGKKQSKL